MFLIRLNLFYKPKLIKISMLKILLDTSFIIESIKYKINIEDKLKDLLLEPFELFIVENTLKELEKKRLKNLSLKMLKGLKTLPSITKHVDDEITSLEGYIVATNDKELKRRLKKKGVKLISLVNKSKYIIT